jgi:hypothetical protein
MKTAKEYNFRLKLNHILQDIVCDKVKPYLADAFKTDTVEGVVWNDFHKTWAWIQMLAYNIDEEEPDRIFDFSADRLLK